jgi:hypothetical protein
MRRRAPYARRLESSCAQWLKPAVSFQSLENSDAEIRRWFRCSSPRRLRAGGTGGTGAAAIARILHRGAGRCDHPALQRVVRMLEKLRGELGPRGFQPVGVVFDPPNTSVEGRLLAAQMTDYFKLTFPVGYTSKENVDSYLARAQNETLSIPQIVVIDRTGTIRATTGGKGADPTLEDESTLRSLIAKLLDEGSSPGAAGK